MENGIYQKIRLKGIHFGSYWMGTNDVVYLMASDLKDICDLIIVDTGIYTGNREKWYLDDYSYSSQRPIRWLNEQKVLDLAKREQIDFVVVNSGGMSLAPTTFNFMKENRIATIGISLSDPDVFFENGKVYCKYYDLFYTNSQYAFLNLYSEGANVRLLPFATSTKLFRPLNDIDKMYDIVVVGHAHPKRIETVKKLKKYFNVGLFGNGWGSDYKEVHGENHVKAINSGNMYLSFAETAAGYMNVKVGVFEAIACKICVATQLFGEMESYFKYGVDILGYVDDDTLVNLIDAYLKNDRLRSWIANNSYGRLLREHTWTKRWEVVLNDIQRCKLG